MVMVIEGMECKENLSLFFDFTKIYQIIFVNKLKNVGIVSLEDKGSRVGTFYTLKSYTPSSITEQERSLGMKQENMH
jgi:hypothetical protein